MLQLKYLYVSACALCYICDYRHTVFGEFDIDFTVGDELCVFGNQTRMLDCGGSCLTIGFQMFRDLKDGV